ncbi:MAG: CPBP family intramembrane glutamic endopeptidase [Candidatus Nanopelagicales bacterium]
MIAWMVVPVIALAGACLLWLGRWAGSRAEAQPDRNPVVAMHLRYQPVAVVVAAATLVAVWMLRLLAGEPVDPRQYLEMGDLSEPATGLGILADPGADWARVGLSFALIATAITAVVVWAQARPRPRLRAALPALPWAVGISVVNAGVEEVIFRVALGQGLSGLAAGGTIAILSGVLFGVPHWFGNPSRLPGVLMAGFLGWLMATSMIQTGGIAWAWGIHALQDVVILTILIASAEAHRRGLIRNPVAAKPGRQGQAITQEP